MTLTKRLFDLLTALALVVLLGPFILAIAIAILIIDGGPVFYVSERMKTPTKGFKLVKFRTMATVATDSGVSGGDKSARITKVGGFLRGKRLDEFPQLWNVIKGDISFVGPRPPLRQYVERYPDIYTKVLKSRPGITGLASIVYHGHEEWLLSKTQTVEETDAVYSRSCIPRKAQLDLIYQKHQNICFDMQLMIRTALRR